MIRISRRAMLLIVLSIAATLTMSSIARGLTISTSAQTTVATVGRITLTDSLLGVPLTGDITLTLSISRTSSSTFPFTIGYVTAGTLTMHAAGVSGSINTTTPWPIVVTRLTIPGAAYGITLQGVSLSITGTPLSYTTYTGSMPTLAYAPPGSVLVISATTLTASITTGAISAGSYFSLSPALAISSTP